MPYRWSEPSPNEKSLTLWPHQSLTAEGLTWFVGGTAFMLTLPLMAVIGTAIAWVLVIFFIATLIGVALAIRANVNGRKLREHLRLSHESVELRHIPQRGAPLEWKANPHWVRVDMRDDGPVEKYLTLTGGGREVEIGAFLTPAEREGLYNDLRRALARA